MVPRCRSCDDDGGGGGGGGGDGWLGKQGNNNERLFSALIYDLSGDWTQKGMCTVFPRFAYRSFLVNLKRGFGGLVPAATFKPGDDAQLRAPPPHSVS